MTAYIVLHQDPTFTGNIAGVDFYQGRGSTSSLGDVARLIALGCTAEDPEAQASAVERNARDAARDAAQASARAAQDAIERRPGYAGTAQRPRRRR